MRTARVILLCSLLASTVVVGPSSHASGLFNVNVVQNPGAEAGTTGWTKSGGATVLSYDRGGLPSCHYSGNKYFAGFASPGVASFFEQTVALSAGAEVVDRGGVAVRMIGTFGAIYTGTASLQAEYLSANGTNLGFASAPGHQAGCGGSLGTNVFHEDVVPIGTRSIRLRVSLPEGSWADDLSLTLVPPPFADLRATGAASSAWAYAKVPFKHTFTVENLGPDVAKSAFLFANPPVGAMVMSSPGCYLSTYGPDPDDPTTYTCEIGSLDPGETATYTFTLRAFKKGAYTTGAFAYDWDDRNGANDNATAATSIGGKYVSDPMVTRRR